MKSAILVVDDDITVYMPLQDVLNEHVLAATTCRTGQEALRRTETQPDIVLILLGMIPPDINGLMVLQQVQKMRLGLPVVMLTGFGNESSIVVGLEIGVDDYIGKPFNVRVSVARVRAVLRCVGVLTAESGGPQTTGFSFNGWHPDTAGCQLHNPQQLKVELMQGEYSLPLVPAQSARRVLSREQLLELMRSDSVEVFNRIIDVLIVRLRRKIENNPHQPVSTKTLHGSGCVLTASVQHRDEAVRSCAVAGCGVNALSGLQRR